MKVMKRKNNIWTAIIVVAVALAFVMPGSTAFANIGTIGVTSNSRNTGDTKNVVESTIDNRYTDTLKPSERTAPDSTVIPDFTNEDDTNPVPPTRGTIYVDDDRPPEWYGATHVKTIQEGVNNASAGDTVYVYNGIYYERVSVNKRVKLYGQSRTQVIIDGENTGNVVSIIAPVNNVNMRTFTIRNSPSYGNGIYLESSSNNTITNCDVYNNDNQCICLVNSSNNTITSCNAYSSQNGICLESSSNNTITNCGAYDTNEYEESSGILLTSSSNDNVITNCIVYNTLNGIRLESSSNNAITNCNAYDTGDSQQDESSGGIGLYGSSNNAITNYTIHNSNNGIYLESSSNNAITNYTAYYTTYSIGLHGSSNNAITNCDAHNNAIGILLQGSSNNNFTNCDVYNNDDHGIRLVDSSNNNIIANSSVYNNGDDYNIYLAGSSNNVITDCDVHDSTFDIGLYSSSNDNVIANSDLYNAEKGIDIVGCSGNTIEDCNVYDTTDNGIDLYSSLNGNIIANSSIYNTEACGILGRSNNIITNCDLYSNVYGSIRVDDTCIITDCNVYDDIQGNGIMTGDNCIITNCNVYNNYVGITIGDNCIITNCTAYNNRRAGIYLLGSSNSIITNCTAYNNPHDGIHIVISTDITLRGNILYDNTCDLTIDGDGGILAYFIHDIDPSNTVNGKPIYYLYNMSNLTLDETRNIGYLGLIFCTNITVKNIDINGVLIVGTTYSTVSNVSSHNSAYGIYLLGGSNNIITHCNAYNNKYYGIHLEDSSDNTITHCTAYNNDYYDGIYIRSSTNTIITNCNVYDNYESGIFLYYSSHCIITNCNAYNNDTIRLEGSSYNTITNCTAASIHLTYLETGPLYYYSNYNVITNCTTAHNSSRGIDLSRASFNTITNCSIYDNNYGIYISGYYNGLASFNTITNCSVYDNTYGIYISGYGYLGVPSASFNTITNCSVYDNTYGIYTIGYYGNNPDNNVIHHNNLKNNIYNAWDVGANTWDDSYPSGGGFWSDYAGVDYYSGPGQNISGSDGIGDIPYVIPGGSNQDRYPLMNPLDDVISPVITAVEATPPLQNAPGSVNITCTVIDNWIRIDTVTVNITGPGGFTLEATMNESSYYCYNNTYTTIGMYRFYIWATDTSGNIAVSDTYTFFVTESESDEPVSAVNPLPLWKKTIPFTVSAVAYDDIAVAGVTLWYRYSSNGTGWTGWASYGTDEDWPWSWSFTGSNGYYQFYSIAVDDSGNSEAPPGVADASTGIDTVSPVTTIGLAGTTGANNWYTSSVTITLSATDTLSGVESTSYLIDTGYWTLYTVPFTMSSQGQHTVSYFSLDHAGNQDVTNSVSLKIDIAAPTTTHTLQGFLGSQGYVTNVTVTLSATDVTSGVNYTSYKLNDGDWIVYTGSFVVTAEGNYTLYCYSVDLAGNTEATKQTSFRIHYDVVPPVSTHEFDGVTWNTDWFVSAVTVMLSATDDSAGVDFTMYKLDDGAWTTYTGAFSVTEEAVHTLYYYSVDKVGNREENNSVALRIDKTPPEINLTVEKTGLSKWLLTATVSDKTSGIAKVEFYLDNEYVGEATESPYEWTVFEEGTAQAIVYDNAGNSKMSDAIPVSVNLDLNSQSATNNQVVSGSQSQSSSITGSLSQSICSTLQRLFNLR
jgi:parallel beta-helix repeat protein